MKPRILLTGKDGQVGSALSPLLPALGQLFAFGRASLDLTDEDAIRRTVRDLRPQLIINAAAYTRVDRAEQDQATAFAVNAHAPAVLADEARMVGASLVHYSTDYVFDGTKTAPYAETDIPKPLNVYGRSKLEGEQAIRTRGVPHLILRTSWVYSRSGHNFLLTILRLSVEREELRIVCDQTGAPTSSCEIAAGTMRILKQALESGDSANTLLPTSGTYNMSAGGETTWYDFAQAILQERLNTAESSPWIIGVTGGRPQLAKRLLPISTEQYPTPARRPAYSVLSNARLLEVFGFQLSDWRAQLTDIFRNASGR